MIIPIRCFTCGKVVADKYDFYIDKVNKLEKEKAAEGINVASTSKAPVPEKKDKYFDTLYTGEILNSIGLTRYCCRRHLLTTVDMMDTI